MFVFYILLLSNDCMFLYHSSFLSVYLAVEEEEEPQKKYADDARALKESCGRHKSDADSYARHALNRQTHKDASKADAPTDIHACVENGSMNRFMQIRLLSCGWIARAPGKTPTNSSSAYRRLALVYAAAASRIVRNVTCVVYKILHERVYSSSTSRSL